MPTAANLNLYRGWNSCVGWHCDDEPLFGKCGDAKLIVSVSRGVSPVLLMTATRAGLTMVTFLSWMVNARTSSFIGRALAWDQERINTTFRWVKKHVSSCLLLKAGVACCLPTCAQGSLVSVMVNASSGIFWVLWFLLGVLCTWRVLALLVSLLCTRLGLLRCASYWTCPPGGVQWRHYLCNLWGVILQNS